MYKESAKSTCSFSKNITAKYLTNHQNHNLLLYCLYK